MYDTQDIHFKIITPAFVSEDFIENTLTSVFNQDYDNFEYIITDDCSEDGTVEKIKKFIEKNECGDYFRLIENVVQIPLFYFIKKSLGHCNKFEQKCIIISNRLIRFN